MRHSQDCPPQEAVRPSTAAKEIPVRLEDSAVIQAVKEYLAALEAGRRPDRQQLLDRYPGITDALAVCMNSRASRHSASASVMPG